MRILMVFPQYPETFWSFKYALKFIFKKSTNPPLGLLTVAAMLPVEWEKKLVDMNVEKLKDKDLEWADLVFISATSIQRRSVNETIDRCKAKKVKIVAGGPLFTSCHNEYHNIDHLVLNEAEITLPQFLKDLHKGTPRHVYATSEWADLKKTPMPSWKLIKMNKYSSMSIQSSRGCPFQCDFCDIWQLYGNRPRVKSTHQIIAELENLYAQKWRGTVFFVDDNFIGNKELLKREILPAITEWMKEHKYPFIFLTQTSVNLADDEELITLMARAGFDTVFVGIETPDELSLAECGKRQNINRDLVASVQKIQRLGLQVQGGFIVGFDSDTITIFERQIRFIQSSGIVTAMVGLLNALHGTRLHQRLEKENRLLKNCTGNNTDCTINFIPKMQHQTLMNGYKKILKTIYSPDFFYARVKNFLKNYKPLRTKQSRLHLYEIRAFIMSIFVLGVREKERFHYWRLFLWSVCHRPRLTPLAVTFAIYGFHFRKVFERMV
ncbi:B12-binding domain-containing radical SAM protein [candidate division WOR-3 bacterium RBG_13_43_14]|uniref:B12-binding domain-containing radical SAM protein n=1 Tax=candidate division WOR-3 bacterium RBG_13_43_14 TaxID=1802590 RepID=A0A1F4UAG1_UNCW3|nr:MAG: B12-binding domain-containing radical SAM protein [candidate division WOR-3 bacterium RBG_13_43_14]